MAVRNTRKNTDTAVMSTVLPRAFGTFKIVHAWVKFSKCSWSGRLKGSRSISFKGFRELKNTMPKGARNRNSMMTISK